MYVSAVKKWQLFISGVVVLIALFSGVGFATDGLFDDDGIESEEGAVGSGELSLNDLFNLQVITSSRKAESRDIAPNVMYVVTKGQIA